MRRAKTLAVLPLHPLANLEIVLLQGLETRLEAVAPFEGILELHRDRPAEAGRAEQAEEAGMDRPLADRHPDGLGAFAGRVLPVEIFHDHRSDALLHEREGGRPGEPGFDGRVADVEVDAELAR